MALDKYLTLDNVLKTLLAVAVGILLYNIFFKKTEGYYNYQSIDKVSNHAYPMDYEDEEYDGPDEAVEEVEEVFDDSEESEDIVDEVILDDSVDEEMYEYEETEEPYDDSADAEEDGVGEIPDEIYEEADNEETVEEEADNEEDDGITPYNAYDFLYASDVEDGLQENFMLYENSVGQDANYS